MSGHRVVVEAELLPTEDGGLKSPLQPGNRSLQFVFPATDENEEPVYFGAVVEQTEGGEPGASLTGQLFFWADLAEVYASPGAEFDIWYSGIVGHGIVKEIVPDL